MDLSAIGYIVWGSSCFLSFITLSVVCGGGFLSRSFRVYLGCQSVCSILWLSRHFVVAESSSSWLEWAFWQSLLIAGCAYVAIGVWIAVGVFGTTLRFQPQEQWKHAQKGLAVGWLLAIAASTGLLVLQLVGDDDRTNVFAIVVFAFYCPAAALAWVDVVAVWWKEWPSTCTGGNNHNRDNAALDISSCGTMSATTIRRVAVVAATVGMIDFLLPALEYLGLPLWESTFFTRLLDSAVYLPGILPWIIYLD